MFTNHGYVILPEYTLYIVSIVIILLILTVMCLIYLILFKIYRTVRTNVSSTALNDEYLKPKTSSFHLPRIQLNRFRCKYVRESDSKEKILYNEPEDNGSESKESNSYTDRVKRQAADQITIIPPDKMKELITDVVNQVNFKNSQKLQMLNNVSVQKNERRSFANFKDRCASVPDLGIYDVVSRVRPVEIEGSSETDGTNELNHPGVKIVQLFSDRHSGYRSPLTLKMMYSNANVR